MLLKDKVDTLMTVITLNYSNTYNVQKVSIILGIIENLIMQW